MNEDIQSRKRLILLGVNAANYSWLGEHLP